MAFSLGRFQEILYKLKTMQDEGKLSTDIPIFADGTLGLRYTALFSKEELEIKPEAVNFYLKIFCFVNKENRTEILESEESKNYCNNLGNGNLWSSSSVYNQVYKSDLSYLKGRFLMYFICKFQLFSYNLCNYYQYQSKYLYLYLIV